MIRVSKTSDLRNFDIKGDTIIIISIKTHEMNDFQGNIGLQYYLDIKKLER